MSEEETVQDMDRPTPLQRTMREQGDWLFRWRSYTPLPLLLALLVWSFVDPAEDGLLSWLVEGLAIPVGLLGVLIRIWVAGLVPGGTSGRGTVRQRADVLNRTGPYSVARNPLYLGNFFMWLAVAMVTGHLSAVALTVAYFWYLYERVIMAEERFLVGQFGKDYEDWAAVTPPVWPRLSRLQPSNLPFSWRTAAKREFTGIFGLVVSMWAMKLASGLGRTGSWMAEPGWNEALVIFTGLYLTMLLLKKQTSVLDEEGR